MPNPLFIDQKLQYPIYDLNLPFDQYIQRCKQLIASARVDLQHDPEKIIEANAPFELAPLAPNGKAVLLIHGLFDCPFTMRDIAAALSKKGYWVRAILLPGHGTVPGNLLNVHYHDWIQAVRYGVSSFHGNYEKLFLIGYSMGATLALHHILHHKTASAGVLLTPAIKIRSNFTFASNWHRIISWWWDRAKWLTIEKENDYARYQSIPYNAVYQAHQFTHHIRELSKKHLANCPLFFAAPLSDATVSTSATIHYFHHYFNKKNQLLLYTNNTKHINDPNTIVRQSVYSHMKIHDLSHIGFTLSEENPHYGIKGDYSDASRIHDQDPVIYGGFNQFENKFYNLLYKNKIIETPRKRLTFNPDFNFLMSSILRFIDV